MGIPIRTLDGKEAIKSPLQLLNLIDILIAQIGLTTDEVAATRDEVDASSRRVAKVDPHYKWVQDGALTTIPVEGVHRDSQFAARSNLSLDGTSYALSSGGEDDAASSLSSDDQDLVPFYRRPVRSLLQYMAIYNQATSADRLSRVLKSSGSHSLLRYGSLLKEADELLRRSFQSASTLR